MLNKTYCDDYLQYDNDNGGRDCKFYEKIKKTLRNDDLKNRNLAKGFSVADKFRQRKCSRISRRLENLNCLHI
jgi:hypothetical protein